MKRISQKADSLLSKVANRVEKFTKRWQEKSFRSHIEHVKSLVQRLESRDKSQHEVLIYTDKLLATIVYIGAVELDMLVKDYPELEERIDPIKAKCCDAIDAIKEIEKRYLHW